MKISERSKRVPAIIFNDSEGYLLVHCLAVVQEKIFPESVLLLGLLIPPIQELYPSDDKRKQMVSRVLARQAAAEFVF